MIARGSRTPSSEPADPSHPAAPGRIATPEAVPPAAWLALALVLAGAIALYLPVIRTGFFADDFLFLDQVRGRSLFQALSAPDPLSNFFRPVSRQLWFWVIAGLTHESPLWFHIGNLATFLGVITLLWVLVRRLAGGRAAMFAAALLALHYAADVPVRWACGSQELLAVAGALAAILLHLSGRRRWAGIAMLSAFLSKEVVLLAPVVAVFADHRGHERWSATLRRAWPLGAALLVWGALSLAMPHTRKEQGTEVRFDLLRSPISAAAHLPQVILGAEWVSGGPAGTSRTLPPLAPLAAGVAALLLAWRFEGGGNASPRGARGSAWRTGLVWVAVATGPVVAVATLWSAYYYLFAICGVALLAGVLLARAPAAVACAVLAAVGLGSAHARALPGFGQGHDPWTSASHINASYVERSTRITASYLASLRRAHPELPPGSTLFFGGLGSNLAFQCADGPLMRWAYRDPTLKSYYMSAFSRRTARAGPLFFFQDAGDTLQEMERSPDLFLRVAFGLLLNDEVQGANDALELAEATRSSDGRVPYWHAWVRFALADTAGATRLLARDGYMTTVGAAQVRDEVLKRFAAGDTLGAIAMARLATRTHAYDAGAHALLADLLLIARRHDPEGTIEALAARMLAPGDPFVWRRWAMIQLDRRRPLQSLESFRRYFDLGGASAREDAEARQLVSSIRAAVPGGAFDPEKFPAD